MIVPFKGIQQFPQIANPAIDIILGVERIGDPQFLYRDRIDLHQAYAPLGETAEGSKPDSAWITAFTRAGSRAYFLDATLIQ